MYIYAKYPLFLCQTGSGSTYVIWGRKQCPPNNYTEQVYSDIVCYCKYFTYIYVCVYNRVKYGDLFVAISSREKMGLIFVNI